MACIDDRAVMRTGSRKKLVSVLLATVSCAVFALGGAAAQENRTITFDDIFENPDDPDLNLRYAQQEARAGNLLASAATLERLLLNDPNWDEARLFYAVVLYRLGDYSATEREIRTLDGRQLSPALLAQLDSLKNRVRGKQSKSSLSGSLALGVTYDDNVAVNLDDEAAGTKVGDYALTARIRGKYTRDLGNEDTKLYASVSTFSKLYEDLGQVNFNFAAGGLGLEGGRGAYDWRTGVTVKGLEIDGEHYLTETGIDLWAKREITTKSSVSVSLSVADQNYNDILLAGNLTNREEQRSGTKTTALINLDRKFSAQVMGSVGIGYQTKKAEYAPYENDSIIFRANLGRAFTNGSYARLSYFYRDVDYLDPDTDVLTPEQLLTGIARQEERHYLRAAVGVPLGALFTSNNGEVQQVLDTVKLEASIFRDERMANYDIYDYDNTGAEVRLIWQFNK